MLRKLNVSLAAMLLALMVSAVASAADGEMRTWTDSTGQYRVRAGTTGSATLILQTNLPALLTASGLSTLTLEGGTHNPWATPFDFLDRCFMPLNHRMGPSVELELMRPGFFPAGGGSFRTTKPSLHTTTNVEVIQRFLPLPTRVDQESELAWRVQVGND